MKTTKKPLINSLSWRASLIMVVMLVTMSYFASAQINSARGRFSVMDTVGCAPLTVDITVLDDLGSNLDVIQYYYDELNFPNDITSATSNTYTQAGTYKLVQTNGKAGLTSSQKRDSINIRVLELTIPKFEIHNCDAHRVKVEITEDVYDYYRVYFTNTDSVDVAPNDFSPEHNYGVAGNYPISVKGLYNNAKDNCGSDNSAINTILTLVAPVLTSSNVLVKDKSAGIIDITQTIGSDIVYNLDVSVNGSDNFIFKRNIDLNREIFNNLNTVDNYYCYNLNTFDACNNVTLRSDTICTAIISAESGDGFNVISWETDTSVVESYNILRDDAIIGQIAERGTTRFEDPNVACKVAYKYQVQPVFTTGTSLSIDTSIVAFQTNSLPVLTFPFSTITNQQIELTWPSVDTSTIPLARYVVEKSNNNGAFKIIASTDTTYYLDADSSFFFYKKYRIRYDDECDNRSEPSIETIPLFLHQDSTDVRGNKITYKWNKFEAWESGIRTYYLERIGNDGQPFEEFSVLSGRSYELEYSPNDIRPKKVRVRAESLDIIPQITYSNVIESELGLEIYFPTAFTPGNRDGKDLNEYFTPKGPLVFNFKMEIYSRWGDLVFYTDDIQVGWDGRIKGKIGKTAAYVYKVSYEDAVGKRYNRSGSFILLRD